MGFHRDLPKPFVDNRLAPRRAPVGSVVEVLPGLCENPQRLLLHGLAPGTKPRVLGAGLGQLGGLLDIAGRLASRSPMPLLLHRQIPHIPRIPAVRRQRVLLLRGRQQPKPRHDRTVITTTDMTRVLSQCFSYGCGLTVALNSEVFHLRSNK
jgi:hypothetical protein